MKHTFKFLLVIAFSCFNTVLMAQTNATSVEDLQKNDVCANAIKSKLGILAKIDNFEFDVKFKVISFDVTYLPKRGDIMEATSNSAYTSGPKANQEVKDIIQNVKIGGKLYFDNIRVVGPDGHIRNIGSLIYNIIC